MTQLTTEPASRQQPEQTGSAVERIAAFAAAAQAEQLTSDIRHLFKRNILDSVGCAIAALPTSREVGATVRRTTSGQRASRTRKCSTRHGACGRPGGEEDGNAS